MNVQSFNNDLPPSVNFHLWQPCNMRCKFCFATFQDAKNTVLPKGHLPESSALKVVQFIADFGFKKITFAGGEPTLCPWLFSLVELAKNKGMTTMLVTNGSRLSEDYLQKFKPVLDWVTLSIDSVAEEINRNTGRAIAGKKVLTKQDYVNICNRIHQSGYRLKINTVVTKQNCSEDMNDFIGTCNPGRWKIFQVLPVKGQNDKCIEELLISKKAFRAYQKRHLSKHHKIMIPESNEDMTGSYIMIDPAGRFFSNETGSHRYSQPIIKAGVQDALKDIHFDMNRFVNRQGFYDWE